MSIKYTPPPTIEVQDDGYVSSGSVDTINFGEGLAVTDDGYGKVTIAATNGIPHIEVKENGTTLSNQIKIFDFNKNIVATQIGAHEVLIDGYSCIKNDGYFVADAYAIDFSSSFTATNDGYQNVIISPNYFTPSTLNPDVVNTEGILNKFARADHLHNIPADTAVSITTINTEGNSTSFSRANHTHQGVHSIKANTTGTERYGDVTIQQGTNISVVDDGAGKITISAVSQIGTGLYIKAGIVAAGSFAGNPKKATITFTTAFPSTNYTITVMGTADGRGWTYESKTTGGFVINTNASAALTGEVSWQAIIVGESA